MDALKAWVRDIAVLALVLGFAEMLLPRNSLRRFAGLVIGLALIAAILGSLVDATLLGGGLAPSFAGADASVDRVVDSAWGARDYAALGDEVARAGLEAATARATEVVGRQVESLARLASGAGGASAKVELGPSGEVAGIEVLLEGLGGKGAEAAAATVEGALRDFYGLDEAVRVSVRARPSDRR